MSVEYSIGVTPTAALLGEPIIAELRCVVHSDVRETLTFDHRSLVVELDREGLTEPALAFPNRHAVERGGQLLRISTAGGIEDLAAGEERTRTIRPCSALPRACLECRAIRGDLSSRGSRPCCASCAGRRRGRLGTRGNQSSDWLFGRGGFRSPVPRSRSLGCDDGARLRIRGRRRTGEPGRGDPSLADVVAKRRLGLAMEFRVRRRHIRSRSTSSAFGSQLPVGRRGLSRLPWVKAPGR